MEAKIQEMEAEKDGLFALMSTDEVARDHIKLAAVNEKYQKIEKDLQEFYQQWEVALSHAQ